MILFLGDSDSCSVTNIPTPYHGITLQQKTQSSSPTPLHLLVANSCSNLQSEDGVGAEAVHGEELEVAGEVARVEPRQRQAVPVPGERHGGLRAARMASYSVTSGYHSVLHKLSLQKFAHLTQVEHPL